MRILLITHLFPPKIGGIETMSVLLARAFGERGHDVRVITATPATSPADDQGLAVLRCPGPLALARAVAWCDVCFHNNICLSYSWPMLLSARPWVVTTQTWIRRPDHTLGWREHLKRLLLRLARPVAISRAVAAALPVPSVVIPNCYDTALFRPAPAGSPPPSRDLILVARLVSDKGVALALEALVRLRALGLRPGLTLVGEGPERTRLERQAAGGGLAGQVVFAGSLQGPALARAFQDHRIQLVPSLWAEPFGIVALEGAACDCLVLGSADGGLADAIGPCGATFPNNDAAALTALLASALRGELPVADAAVRQAHLDRHSLAAVTAAYLDLFRKLLS